MQTGGLVKVLILILAVHPFLSLFFGHIDLLSVTVASLLIVSKSLLLLVAFSSIGPIAITIQISVILIDGRVIIGMLPLVWSMTVLLLVEVGGGFGGGVVRLFIFLHDGEDPLIHPVGVGVEGERREVWLFVHFSIKIIIAIGPRYIRIHNL